MARPTNRLPARKVQTIREPGRHADGRGLYLQVDASGARRWVFVFQWQGRRKEMGLGGFGDVGLAEAREAVDAARKLVRAGINPIEERRADRVRGKTFGEVADALMASMAADWSNEKHRSQWETSLERHAAPIRNKPVRTVTTDDVLAILKPIWTTIPETASRTRGRIERVLDAAAAQGHRSGENPARWKGHLAHLLPKRQKLTRGHHPALPFDQTASFMEDLRARPAMAAKALEFAILTAARTGEVLGARWEEIDFKALVWTVPPERMKGRKEHRVPLSSPAVKVLTALREAPGAKIAKTDLVFPGARDDEPLSNMALSMLLRRMGYNTITVHGFRSTFREWAGEATAFPREVAEAALAHQIGNEVERAYRRGDALQKRRKLMDAWAGYCGRPKGGEVVEMRRA